jgi:hypothetical protein
MPSIRVVVTVVGLALVTVLFLLILPWPWPDRAWLPYVVTCLVLLTNVGAIGMFFRPARDVGRRIASLGILWLADGTYTVLALGGAYSTFWYVWPVRFQVAYQLVLLVGLGLAHLVARSADRHVDAVQFREREITGRLEELRTLSPEQQVALRRLRTADPARAARFERWLEDVRYLSPLETAAAADLDKSLLSLSARFLSSPTDDALDMLETLLVSRKSLTAHDDLRSHY